MNFDFLKVGEETKVKKNMYLKIASVFGLVALLLLASCVQAISSKTDVAVTLPNGVTISAAEKAQLDSLVPEARNIQRSIAARGVNGGGATDEATELRHQFRDLLKSKFGDNWKKYVIITESGVITDGNGKEFSRAAPHAVDPDTLDAEEGSGLDSARSLTTGGADQDYYSYPNGMWVGCFVHNNWWWWGQNNDATTKFATIADSISVNIVDSLTPNGVPRTNVRDNYVNTTGNWQWGFFPALMRPTTTHQAKLKYIVTVNGVDSIVNLDSGALKPIW